MNDTTLIISGGTVICEDAVLPEHDVFVRNGRIAAIRPSAGYRAIDAAATRGVSASEADSRMLVDYAQSIIDGRDSGGCAQGERFADAHAGVAVRRAADGTFDGRPEGDAAPPTLPVVIDARGAYVAPGMIDVHSDFIETVASPRPSVVMDLRTSLYQAERELVAHGITTIYHSLSVYGETVFDHKPIRNFDNVVRLIDEVAAMRDAEEREHLIRHRLHLRIEIDAVGHYERIKELIASGAVDMISFMDHTPGQGQYSDLEIFGDTLKGYRDIGDEEVARIVQAQQQSDKLSLAQMTELARLAHSRGISVASHDDDSVEKLDRMASFDAAISEFPITMGVAHSARERGMHTLAGAPNVMMGRSHSGNLSAREAVRAGAVDMLCSDYYPAAMLGAVFVLHQAVGIDLAEAFALVTANPAKAAGIGDEAGSLAVGKLADIVVVRELPVRGAADAPAVPVVTDSFVGGRCVHRSLYPLFAGEACGGETSAALLGHDAGVDAERGGAPASAARREAQVLR